jgi:hypothetical protein
MGSLLMVLGLLAFLLFGGSLTTALTRATFTHPREPLSSAILLREALFATAVNVAILVLFVSPGLLLWRGTKHQTASSGLTNAARQGWAALLHFRSLVIVVIAGIGIMNGVASLLESPPNSWSAGATRLIYLLLGVGLIVPLRWAPLANVQEEQCRAAAIRASYLRLQPASQLERLALTKRR